MQFFIYPIVLFLLIIPSMAEAGCEPEILGKKDKKMIKESFTFGEQLSGIPFKVVNAQQYQKRLIKEAFAEATPLLCAGAERVVFARYPPPPKPNPKGKGKWKDQHWNPGKGKAGGKGGKNWNDGGKGWQPDCGKGGSGADN